MKKINKPKHEEHACEYCGDKAVTTYYGIDRQGNERYVTDCSNPRCPSHHGQQHLGQFLPHDENVCPTFRQWVEKRNLK